jgi:hypothetical protein
MKTSVLLAVSLLALACNEYEPPPAVPAPAPCPASSVAPVASASVTPPAATLLDVDRIEALVVERLNAKDGAGLFALYGDSMKKAVPLDKAEAFVAGVAPEAGTLANAGPLRHHGGYVLEGRNGKWFLDLNIDLNIDDRGAITGLLLRPRPPEPPVAKSDIPLALPFRGQWTVLWGGDTPQQNMHVSGADAKGTPWSQRRAVDILIKGQDGKTYKGDGKKNEGYLAYGLPIVAVADGEVTTVIDGVHENEPGTKNPTYVAGNLVILRHGPSLYSSYAHLVPGKIKVKVGAKVKRGEVLGLCGNSGNATEPHLHFQLEDGPWFESSWGVLPVFSGVRVTRGGETKTDDAYTLLKGDVIEPAK